jgi:hypothetical protein
METFAFCVITYEQIKVLSHSVPKNDSLILSFVKDIMWMAKKWLEMSFVSLHTFFGTLFQF